TTNPYTPLITVTRLRPKQFFRVAIISEPESIPFWPQDDSPSGFWIPDEVKPAVQNEVYVAADGTTHLRYTLTQNPFRGTTAYGGTFVYGLNDYYSPGWNGQSCSDKRATIVTDPNPDPPVLIPV